MKSDIIVEIYYGIYHITGLKEETHMIISIDKERLLKNIQYPFML